jgi:hypothetical protein
VVCNSGVSLIPTVDGKTFHFVNAGLYDALFVMQDIETRTLWSHITGTAMYGELAGHRLPVSNLLQLSVQQALDMDPDMEVAISDRPGFGGGRGGRGGTGGPRPGSGDGRRLGQSQLMGDFVTTLGVEDDRRPRMDMGLGVWTEDTRRYYPLETIEAGGGVLLDELDGRGIVVYIDPSTATPLAVFVDAAEGGLEGSDVVLDGGRRIRSGMLVGEDGASERVGGPQQIFTRWYGYALTFPDPEIYDG